MAETYEFDYFSSAQVSVFIGDVWIADLASIQFTVNQQRMPIYGYASQYYHSLADGRVMAEGQFSIAFKEAAYFIETLRNHINKFDERPKQSVQTAGNRTPIEVHAMDPKKRDSYDFIKYQLGTLSDEEFENVAEQFTNVHWTNPDVDYLTPNVSGGIGREDMISTYRRADQYPPFDIYIVYGDYFSEGSMAKNNTVKKIIDATIVGSGQSFTFGGEAIYEVYNFVARNIA